jgi:hypothetical protein
MHIMLVWLGPAEDDGLVMTDRFAVARPAGIHGAGGSDDSPLTI